MISKIAWIPRGAAAKNPVRFDINYMNEEDELNENDIIENNEIDESFSLLNPSMEMISEDLGVDFNDMNVEDDEDEDDMGIKDTDLCICVGMTEEEWSAIQIYVYDEPNGSLFVHHDITLPTFPLALSWMNFVPKRIQYDENDNIIIENNENNDNNENENLLGNFLAIGTFYPEIEIWNLDIIDPIEPTCVLKGHEDAVICLAWNKLHRNILASGSGDKTVKLWDLSDGTCLQTYYHHEDKVQSLSWNPSEYNILATGSYDKTIHIIDCTMNNNTDNNNNNNNTNSLKIQLESDIESLCWNPFQPFHIIVSTEKGYISCYDIRQGESAPLFNKRISKKPVTSISFSSSINGLMATSSVDKSIKIWDIRNINEIELIGEKKMGIGQLMTMQFSPTEPFMLSAGGSRAILGLWDLTENSIIMNRFNNDNIIEEHNNNNNNNHIMINNDDGNNSNDNEDNNDDDDNDNNNNNNLINTNDNNIKKKNKKKNKKKLKNKNKKK